MWRKTNDQRERERETERERDEGTVVGTWRVGHTVSDGQKVVSVGKRADYFSVELAKVRKRCQQHEASVRRQTKQCVDIYSILYRQQTR